MIKLRTGHFSAAMGHAQWIVGVFRHRSPKSIGFPRAPEYQTATARRSFLLETPRVMCALEGLLVLVRIRLRDVRPSSIKCCTSDHFTDPTVLTALQSSHLNNVACHRNLYERFDLIGL